mmetsp:Transcript_129690/g.224150  ORF Transcript_129690/g.224150 Transcript_129690/m.224150 type:complete len:234 (-) Transcript_129690:296-997(-)
MLGKVFEQASSATVEDSLVHILDGVAEQRHSRCLVDTPGLGPQDAVLKGVTDTDSVTATNLVCCVQDFKRCHCLPIDGHTTAFFEAELHFLYCIRCLLRPYTHNRVDNRHRGFQGLKVLGLIAQPADVRISGIALGGLGHDLVRNIVLVQKFQHLGSSRELIKQGLVTPRCVDSESWIQNVHVSLETDLVVSATCRSMRQNGTTVFLHSSQQAAGSDNSPKTRRLPVASVVLG